MVECIRSAIVRIPRGCISAAVLVILLTVCAVPAHSAGKLVTAVLSSDSARYRDAHRAFVKILAQNGYDQNNVEIVVQRPNPDPISWANSVRKVMAIGADLIVAYGAPITLTAMRETEDIPIIFVDVYGPVETGVSRSMTVTGRNLTGVSSKVPMITLIKTALEIKPVRSLGVIYNSREVGSVVQLKELKRIAAQLGFTIIETNVSSPGGLEAALNQLLAQADCLYVSECAFGSNGFEKIVQRANDHKIPVISQMPDAAEKGALVALEVSTAEQGQLAGECAVKVLNGRKVGQIPIATPKKIDMIVNMRAAKVLDLHIPFQVLGSATRVLK